MVKNKKEDCPQQLFKIAKTKWQKEVALTLIGTDKQLALLKVELRILKWIVSSIFVAVFINVIVGLI